MLMVFRSAAIRHVWGHTQAVWNRLHWCMPFSSRLYKIWFIMCGKTNENRNRNNTIHNRSNTTETAHNTYIYIIYSSVAISAHCCLHWCSHLTSIPPFLLRTCRVRHCTTASSLVRAAASPCRVQESPRTRRRYLWSNSILMLQSRYCIRRMFMTFGRIPDSQFLHEFGVSKVNMYSCWKHDWIATMLWCKLPNNEHWNLFNSTTRIQCWCSKEPVVLKGSTVRRRC